MKKIGVLIADDHAVVRDGIRQILGTAPDMQVLGEAANGREALQEIRTLQPDVLLLDISMPELNGLEAIYLIREASPATQVVVLTMYSKESYVRHFLAAGARGYVLKASPSRDILEAIRAASRKEYFLSAALQESVVAGYLKPQYDAPCVRGYDLLTEREQQVFRLIAQGESSRQIAECLCISVKTVEKHRTNIMNKLALHDRFGLLKYAIKIGVVDTELWNE